MKRNKFLSILAGIGIFILMSQCASQVKVRQPAETQPTGEVHVKEIKMNKMNRDPIGVHDATFEEIIPSGFDQVWLRFSPSLLKKSHGRIFHIPLEVEYFRKYKDKKRGTKRFKKKLTLEVSEFDPFSFFGGIRHQEEYQAEVLTNQLRLKGWVKIENSGFSLRVDLVTTPFYIPDDESSKISQDGKHYIATGEYARWIDHAENSILNLMARISNAFYSRTTQSDSLEFSMTHEQILGLPDSPEFRDLTHFRNLQTLERKDGSVILRENPEAIFTEEEENLFK